MLYVLFGLLMAQAPATDASQAFRIDDFRNARQLRFVGSAKTEKQAARLTPAKNNRSGGLWYREKQPVAWGFDTEFEFQLTNGGGLADGADGIAFVIQNKGNSQLAGSGQSGGFAPGDAFGNPNRPGIPESIAVFFDTFQNDVDPSDNYVVLYANGRLGEMRWPPPRLGMSEPQLRVKMKDGRVHRARIRYVRPILSVYLDDPDNAVLRVPVDLTPVTGRQGKAWVGFTAATGGGYENHDILSWSFFSEQVDSTAFDVSSEISYNLADCMEGRNLCTPEHATVEEQGPGEWRVILPGHLEWGASIPNPERRTVQVTDARGTVCFGPNGAAGCADAASAVAQKTEAGRTWFSVSRAGRDNQGFIELRVRLVR